MGPRVLDYPQDLLVKRLLLEGEGDGRAFLPAQQFGVHGLLLTLELRRGHHEAPVASVVAGCRRDNGPASGDKDSRFVCQPDGRDDNRAVAGGDQRPLSR